MPPRSYLFVPGDRPERFEKALASGADAVVLDLEDAVAPAGQARRARCRRRLLASRRGRRERIVVRINDESTPWFEADLALLRDGDARAVMLPKAERTATIERCASDLSRHARCCR